MPFTRMPRSGDVRPFLTSDGLEGARYATQAVSIIKTVWAFPKREAILEDICKDSKSRDR